MADADVEDADMEDCADIDAGEELTEDVIMEDYTNNAPVDKSTESDISMDDYDNSDADPDYVPDDESQDNHGTCMATSHHTYSLLTR